MCCFFPSTFPRHLFPSDIVLSQLYSLRITLSHKLPDRSLIPKCKLPLLLLHSLRYCHLSSLCRIPNIFLFPPAAPLTSFSQLFWLLFQFHCSHKRLGLPSCSASFLQTIPVIHHSSQALTYLSLLPRIPNHYLTTLRLKMILAYKGPHFLSNRQIKEA